MRIVFFGTPEIAAYCLEKIIVSENEVVGVVTMPDKAAGRGQKILCSPVKQMALNYNIKVLQPTNLKSNEFLDELKSLNAEMFIVVAFRMMPKEVWAMPKNGTINLHASLLPDYRGAAPINWAIINGEPFTGITTFFINEIIDTGKIIFQEKINIDFKDTAEKLYNKIMVQGAELLVKTINKIEKNEFDAVEQENFLDENKQLKPAPKIFKENCKINWANNALDIYNFIRGLSPIPAAWSVLQRDNKSFIMKILFSEFEICKHELKTGTILFDKFGFKVAVNDGFVKIIDLVPEGKKPMKAEEFVRGFNLTNCFF